MNLSVQSLLKMFLMLVLLVGAFTLSSVPHSVSSAQESAMVNKSPFHTANIAHRGASGYAPENTMAAFDRAFEMKADYIELDVHMSKDGEVVAIHDATLDRTTDGSGRVDEYTLDELRQFDAGSWFDSAFAGENIPTLEEVLDEYRGKIGLLIEVKDPSDYPGIEEKIAAALVERNMDKPNNGKIIVQSFDHDSMEHFHGLLPNLPVGVLVSYNADGISDEQLAHFSTYADYVNPNQQMVDHDLVQRIHEQGMQITPWTVNSQSRVNELIDLGVDGIITDYPDLISHTGPPHKK